MNYFLNNTDHQQLLEMSILRATKYKNSKGVRVSGKLLLLGDNTVKLANISLREAINGKYYIILTFTRKPASIEGLKSKVTFAPHWEFLFDYEILLKPWPGRFLPWNLATMTIHQ